MCFLQSFCLVLLNALLLPLFFHICIVSFLTFHFHLVTVSFLIFHLRCLHFVVDALSPLVFQFHPVYSGFLL